MTRHRFDPLSFVFGALFVLLAVVAIADVPALRLVDVRLVGPGALILAGLTLLLSMGGSDRVPSVTPPPAEARTTAPDAHDRAADDPAETRDAQ